MPASCRPAPARGRPAGHLRGLRRRRRFARIARARIPAGGRRARDDAGSRPQRPPEIAPARPRRRPRRRLRDRGVRRIAIIGAGGVGAAAAAIARHRDFFEQLTLADIDVTRAARVAAQLGDERMAGTAVDASARNEVAAFLRDGRFDAVLNAGDPRLNPPIFAAAREIGVTYLDMAMTLSRPHPTDPYRRPGELLGAEQFAADEDWRRAGLLALVGIGVEPGLSDVFARHAADTMFSSIDEVAVRDGANLTVSGNDFAPSFSIWTTIEECLNPPLIWERDRGFFTTEPFSDPETFVFPGGIGPIECVNVEHEEVVLVPRCIDCRRVTFKYGLGSEFIEVLQVLHKLGLDGTDPVTVRGMQVSPRDVVAAVLPDPATLGDRMSGVTCAGTFVTGTGSDGRPRATYLYHLADNQETMARDGCQAVVWQTAINPIVALELLAEGVWSGAGVLGPEAFDAAPFLELLAQYGSPHGSEERLSVG
ncbi:MAG: saccharopine dehydrogenase NADP-binding domain-containing protein [Solirubrobacterales bacterium]|nr:saccharopine dehydrogenase NADP-binding domain-containing protein [Solirubrobacterales bacterium]